jgi:hypothetical protein
VSKSPATARVGTPRWAYLVDAVVFGLAGIACWIVLFGGIRLGFLFGNISLTSSLVFLYAAFSLLAVRHLVRRQPTILEFHPADLDGTTDLDPVSALSGPYHADPVTKRGDVDGGVWFDAGTVRRVLFHLARGVLNDRQTRVSVRKSYCREIPFRSG